MNNAVYALPGFMPPHAPNWKSRIDTKEDGSIKLCVFCGEENSTVFYSIGIPGWKNGQVKDPAYFSAREYPERVRVITDTYPEYLTKVHTLDSDVVIPKIVINGFPIPITEKRHITDKYYWILNIPEKVLPVGDSKVEVSADGKVFHYIIHRPEFAIHDCKDVTNAKEYW